MGNTKMKNEKSISRLFYVELAVGSRINTTP
jgi:hypothetical protein